MNIIETEVKAVAKAVGASLKRQGHEVPHSVVLHAVSAALNRRDWHKLKTVITSEGEAPMASSIAAHPDAFDAVWNSLSEKDKFWSAVAGAQGVTFNLNTEGWMAGVKMVGEVRSAARERFNSLESAARGAFAAFNLEKAFTATLVNGISVLGRATFNLVGNCEFTNFDAALTRNISSLSYPCEVTALVRLGDAELVVTAYGASIDRWYMPATAQAKVWDQVIGSVDVRYILGFSGQQSGTSLQVPAEFWSDDRLYEVKFDAVSALESMSLHDLWGILTMGACGNEYTDAVALYEEFSNAELAEGLNYVRRTNDSGKTMGFECSLDEGAFRKWMDAHRRLLLAEWFCDNEGVQVTLESTSNRYQWTVKRQDEGAPKGVGGFLTIEAAQLDAYLAISKYDNFLH